MRVWHVRKGAEAKVRRGYPWVFSNELAHSPKEAEPGEPIELRDFTDAPIAFGYGHPHSLIAFRTFTLGAQPWDGTAEEFLLNRLQRAAGLRRRLGLDGTSHRMCFAEADGLPGLIVDRYRLDGPDAPAQVLAVQVSTAGMDRALPDVWRALERLIAAETAASSKGARTGAGSSLAGAIPWERTALLLDQGSSLRALEELPVLPKVWQKLPPGAWDGTQPASILVAVGLGASQGEPLSIAVDFLGGQKTGFFLDHRANLGLARDLVAALLDASTASGRSGPLRVLDLFSYVGQWGGVLAREASRRGIAAEVLAVDASERALGLARRNIAALASATVPPEAGAAAVLPPRLASFAAVPVERPASVAAPVAVQTERRDIIESLEGIPAAGFDVVVCDPPALVKRRKDLLKAQRAYQKLNREALRRVKPGGLIVTCSCSGLMGEEDFREVLQRAQVQAGRSVQWVARGGQGLDHPVRAEFPEGRYLKCWLGIVDG